MDEDGREMGIAKEEKSNQPSVSPTLIGMEAQKVRFGYRSNCWIAMRGNVTITY